MIMHTNRHTPAESRGSPGWLFTAGIQIDAGGGQQGCRHGPCVGGLGAGCLIGAVRPVVLIPCLLLALTGTIEDSSFWQLC